ncbi:ABC transporter substrate-binding protein [uncultured Mailhella sp.]|uniref:ABC transporter substrate-binding protein n=1 Tax=uncultured Mailhella sp. TaxID=1981031 RepID=UPI00260A6C78|nr:ABC transporter substrate-binding protein [uncultured Mailhella sp.]
MLNIVLSALLACVLAAPALAADVLKIGTLPAADSVLLYAAREDGVFARHGLDVDIVPFQSALELGAAMRAGALDGHFGDIINVLMQNETDAPQVIVATTSHSAPEARYFGLAVSPHSKISSPDELTGRTCAIGRATIVEFILDELLARTGGRADAPEKQDIRQIPVRVQMLLAGRMDSALLPEPLLSLVEASGARVLLDDQDLDITLAVIALRRPENGVDNAFADKVIRFRAALAEEAGTLDARPEKRTALLKAFRLLPEKAEANYRAPRFGDTSALPTESDLDRYAAWMERKGLLKKGLPDRTDIVFQER